MPPKSTKSRKTKVKKEVIINEEEVQKNNEKPIKDYEPVIESVEYKTNMTHREIAKLEKKLRMEQQNKD